MAKQVIEVYAESKAPREAVWQLLADVTTWTGWAQFEVAEYERQGDTSPHGLGAVRRFAVAGMRSREHVLAFEEPRHFAYDYVGTLPIDGYRGDVTLAEHEGGTRITWHSEFEGRYPLTGPLVRAFLAWVLQGCATRLAKAAEELPSAQGETLAKAG